MYRGTNYHIPAHICETQNYQQCMKVNTLFSSVSHIDKPDLYAFVVKISREAQSEIMIKPSSHGIVEDLCEIVTSIYGMNVNSVIGVGPNSWVMVSDTTGEARAFLDMNECASSSPDYMGIVKYFNQDPTFLQCFSSVSPQFTDLVLCFDSRWALAGINEQADVTLYNDSTECIAEEPIPDHFPWTASLDVNKTKSILHSMLDALCLYAYIIPLSQLILTAHRIFLVREPKLLALINFESNEDLWIANQAVLPTMSIEDKFNKMLTHAQQYGTATKEITSRLLFYYAKLYCENMTKGHIHLDPYECYRWCTDIDFNHRPSLMSIVLKEKQQQESLSFLFKTTTGTILPIIWDDHMQIHRGFLIDTDTHPQFGSLYELRTYVENNIRDLLKVTAEASKTPRELRALLKLWEMTSKFVVDDMHLYIEMCSWVARDVFIRLIDMYTGKAQQIDLHTFLERTLQVYKGFHRKLSGEIALLEESTVFFLTMPTETQCLSVKAFDSVKAADPVATASAIFINAFHIFLSHTDASECGVVHVVCDEDLQDQPVDESENIGVDFPKYVATADKETLYILLQSMGLEHLLALTPFIPEDKLWLGAVIGQGGFQDIFSLASNAMLIGMTRDLVVFQFEKKLFARHSTEAKESAVGYTLVTEVVKAYNMLLVASGSPLRVANIKYSVSEVVMLFRSLNMGYRETTADQPLVDQSLLCEAMTCVLLGSIPTVTYYLRALWSNVVKFSLGGSISHRSRDDFEKDTTMNCMNTLMAATIALHSNLVDVTEVLPGSIYFLQENVPFTFMVAPDLLQKHEDIIRNVQLENVCTDPCTIGVLASLIIGSLGLHGKESCKVINVNKIYRALYSRHKPPNPIPFIVRQLMRVLFSAYLHLLYFPAVEADNEKLISTWESSIADESIPFSHKLINIVMVDGLPKESTWIDLDITAGVIVQNGMDSKNKTSCSMLATDWPLSRKWEKYVTLVETIRSALNLFKENIGSQQVSSLMRFSQTLNTVWDKVEEKKCAMQALLPKNLTIDFLDSMSTTVEQIRESSGVSAAAILKIFDNVMIDDAISVVTHDGVSVMQLLGGKQHNNVLTINEYPFALLDKSIALEFYNTSIHVTLVEPINKELLDITKRLMCTDDNVQMGETIKNDVLASWLLACMPMLPVEKQRRASPLCLSGLMDDVQLFWDQNTDLLQRSILDAVNSLIPGTVTKEVHRQFLRGVFVPFVDNINRNPRVGACLLLDPASTADYYILCTNNKTSVGLLSKRNVKPEALITWVESTITLLATHTNSPLHVFIEQIKTNGPCPVMGDAIKELLVNMPPFLVRQKSSEGAMSTVTRASILNALTRDIPALKIYTKNDLVAAGQILATSTQTHDFSLH